jgi:hypothetical protein
LPDQLKESIIVPIYKKGGKTDCSNYRGISLLSTSYKILSNILLSSLSPYIDEITGDNQCVFKSNLNMYNLDYFSRHYSFPFNIILLDMPSSYMGSLSFSFFD